MTIADPRLNALRLLLQAFPALAHDDADGVVRAYLVAIEDVADVDVGAGVRDLVAGRFAGHDGRFAPTAPVLGRACRAARDRRIESEERTRRYTTPRLAPPGPSKSPESRARVAELAARALGGLVPEPMSRLGNGAFQRPEASDPVGSAVK